METALVPTWLGNAVIIELEAFFATPKTPRWRGLVHLGWSIRPWSLNILYRFNAFAFENVLIAQGMLRTPDF